MKLALVNFYSGHAERGGETFIDSLATALTKKNVVFLFQAGKVTPKPYNVISKNIDFNSNHPHSKLPTTHFLKRLFLDYFSLKIFLFTIKIIADLIKLKPDYIYPLNSGWQILFLTLISRIIGTKIIIGGHSGPGWNDRVNLLFHPDIFIALTQAQANWAKKVTVWNNQKITVIPNGIDTEKFSPKGNKKIVDLEKPIIIAVGAATESKGLVNTIKAVASQGNSSLLICGSGPEEKYEDTLGESLLGNRYRRLRLNHSDMPEIYRASNVFTLCSDSSEAFGIVYLEALASGLPCVATDDASRREILGDVGIFVKNPEDSKEYAEKINKALKTNNSERNIKQAHKFDWEIIADKYEKILDQK